VVRLLLAVEGVSVNQARATKTGCFPLYIACKKNHVEVVRLLLAAQAQVNQVAHRGWSACHMASEDRHVQVLEMLLEAGANVQLKSDNGLTALEPSTSSSPPPRPSSANTSPRPRLSPRMANENTQSLFLSHIIQYRVLVVFLFCSVSCVPLVDGGKKEGKREAMHCKQ